MHNEKKREYRFISFSSENDLLIVVLPFKLMCVKPMPSLWTRIGDWTMYEGRDRE